MNYFRFGTCCEKLLFVPWHTKVIGMNGCVTNTRSTQPEVDFVLKGRTLHMCTDGCVLVTIRHGQVLRTVTGSTTKP